MHLLILNAGSSSLKYRLFSADGLADSGHGTVDRIGLASAHQSHHWRDGEGVWQATTENLAVADHGAAFALIRRHLAEAADSLAIAAIGHRVVHGGDHFSAPATIDDRVEAAIEALIPLAPLHNPASLAVIRLCRREFPRLPQAAVFDTAYHQTLPERAWRYAVPDTLYRRHQVRRYGFHGISHSHVAGRAATYLQRPLAALKLISLHLGNGASAAAIDGGQCIDTSMGMTPLEGLVMGTRCGDIDPAVIFHLARERGDDLAAVEQLLLAESGLKGLCGASDMREIRTRTAAGDAQAQLALDIYGYRIRKYIGAYFAALGGVDALIFTAGVGENHPQVRALACQGLDRLGIAIDPARNAAATGEIAEIQHPGANPRILVIRTNEELEIARQLSDLISTG
jgi:acetate kinase